MSLTTQRLASLFYAALGVAAVVVAPVAAADPDIDSESAAAVIDELQEQGYTVEINGVPSGDTALLTSCTVTAIHDSDTAATVFVDVACPIQRG